MGEARYAAECARDQGTTLTCIFSVMTEAGKEREPDPSSCNTEAMNLHLLNQPSSEYALTASANSSSRRQLRSACEAITLALTGFDCACDRLMSVFPQDAFVCLLLIRVSFGRYAFRRSPATFVEGVSAICH